MWECLTKGLCQRKCDKTHVWNIENQKHLEIHKQKLPKHPPKLDVVELDWNRGRRIDSYYVVEGTTQTIIRQEIYKKICLQQKTSFHTKDLFSVSMRNVNERIINERKFIIPVIPNFSFREMSNSPDPLEGEFLGSSNVVEVQVESSQCVTEGAEASCDAQEDQLSYRGSEKLDSGDRQVSEIGEDPDTMMTDVEEADSIENYATPASSNPQTGSEHSMELCQLKVEVPSRQTTGLFQGQVLEAIVRHNQTSAIESET
ncbi:hypothetical protein J6590_058240 [Homalodisca vitripennis]|nr:hypothetical protein J6590_058240 [Homalodisca vitripennis]